MRQQQFPSHKEIRGATYQIKIAGKARNLSDMIVFVSKVLDPFAILTGWKTFK
jgi:hypothetical protein